MLPAVIQRRPGCNVPETHPLLVRPDCHPELVPRPTKDLLQHGIIPFGLHVSIPERQHVRLQRGTEAAKDTSTPFGTTCIAANANPWQPGFRCPGQSRPSSPIESTFRTSSPRTLRFLNSRNIRCKGNNKRLDRVLMGHTKFEGRMPSLRIRVNHVVIEGRSTSVAGGSCQV